MLEGSVGGSGAPAGSQTLLGESVHLRSQLEAIKVKVEEGPGLLKLCCFLCCSAAVVYDVISLISELFSLEPFQMINTGYAGFFALLCALLEFQQVFIPSMKKWLNVWVKILNRTLGRGILLIGTGGLHLAIRNTFGYVLGSLLVACGVSSIMISRVASSKLNKLHDDIIAGHTDDLVYVRQVFNRMDTEQTGFLTSAQLAAAAKELGSEFTAAELVAIFDYLDTDGDGQLSYDEFEGFWKGDLANYSWSRVPIV